MIAWKRIIHRDRLVRGVRLTLSETLSCCCKRGRVISKVGIDTIDRATENLLNAIEGLLLEVGVWRMGVALRSYQVVTDLDTGLSSCRIIRSDSSGPWWSVVTTLIEGAIALIQAYHSHQSLGNLCSSAISQKCRVISENLYSHCLCRINKLISSLNHDLNWRFDQLYSSILTTGKYSPNGSYPVTITV